MAYTINEIDDALRDMGGLNAVRRGDPSWHRPLVMLNVAAQAWIEQRHEDKHSRVLREALQDMNNTGALRPEDGIWPED